MSLPLISLRGCEVNLNRCPICHCPVDVFALAKDEATSQLLAKLANLDTLTGNALMDYLTLFSPEKTALTANKALRLVTEVEALADGDMARMALAMATMVDGVRAKQQRGETLKAFTNHNYLKKVFEQAPAGQQLASRVAGLSIQGTPTPNRPQSATMTALETLEAMKNE